MATMWRGPVRLTAVLTFLALAGESGCHRTAAAPPRSAADTPAEDAAAADIIEHHRHHHHGGTLMLVTMSLDDLGLPAAEQAQVDQIQSSLLADMRPAAEVESALVAALADGVAGAKIDATATDAAIEKLSASSAAAHATAAADLDRLHALLTPPQRGALVDKLDAQWALWKRANAGDQSHLPALSREIGLDPVQIDELRHQLASSEAAAPLREAEIERHLQEFGIAFQGQSFDAKSLSSQVGEDSRHMAGWGTVRLARFCEAVNPLLRPAQRQKLVDLLRAHAAHDDAQAKGATP